MNEMTWRHRMAALVDTARERERAIAEQRLHDALDAYGAPGGITLHDRLRAWEQRERAAVEARDQLCAVLAGAPCDSTAE